MKVKLKHSTDRRSDHFTHRYRHIKIESIYLLNAIDAIIYFHAITSDVFKIAKGQLINQGMPSLLNLAIITILIEIH